MSIQKIGSEVSVIKDYLFEKINNKINKLKETLIFVFLFGFISHGFMFCNNYLSHDCLSEYMNLM